MPSPSPPRDRDRPRNRSRSPRHDRDRPRNNRGGGGGFRWKDKPTRASDPSTDQNLQRGYRAPRDAPRRRYDDNNEPEDRRRSRSPRDRERKERRREERRREDDDDRLGVADKFGGPRKEGGSRKETKKAAPPKMAPTQEPMIIVTVNDRLGTKAQIPCLASDPVKLFKAQVAARIGRQPHEIMLKRQGERPFKDQLTLEDYGVSDGVQLDLELDTGD